MNQQIQTVREKQLENLLRECLPIIRSVELSTKTSTTLRSLLADVEYVLNEPVVNNG